MLLDHSCSVSSVVGYLTASRPKISFSVVLLVRRCNGTNQVPQSEDPAR